MSFRSKDGSGPQEKRKTKAKTLDCTEDEEKKRILKETDRRQKRKENIKETKRKEEEKESKEEEKFN